MSGHSSRSRNEVSMPRLLWKIVKGPAEEICPVSRHRHLCAAAFLPAADAASGEVPKPGQAPVSLFLCTVDWPAREDHSLRKGLCFGSKKPVCVSFIWAQDAFPPGPVFRFFTAAAPSLAHNTNSSSCTAECRVMRC